MKPSHVDIVKDRQRLHERSILGHQRGFCPEPLIKKAEQGGFPCSALADERDPLARIDPCIEPAENFLAVIAGRFIPELKQRHQSISPIDFAVFSIGA